MAWFMGLIFKKVAKKQQRRCKRRRRRQRFGPGIRSRDVPSDMAMGYSWEDKISMTSCDFLHATIFGNYTSLLLHPSALQRTDSEMKQFRGAERDRRQKLA